MTVDKLAEMLNATTVNQADFSREIVGGYAGDLLSFVMGRAPENCAWYTVMTNVNVAAVVVLCEDCLPDPTLVERAKTQGINVIATTLPVYDAIAAVCCNED